MEKMNRVLHVISNMDMGGAETMIMNIYRSIDRSKVQFDFLVSVKKKSYYDDEIKRMGGEIYHTDIKSKHPIKFSKDLWKLIKTNNYSTIHVHASNTMSTIPIFISMLAGVRRRIIHSHSSNSSLNKVIHYAMRPILNATATDRFSCSDLAAKWMYGENSEDKAIIINNPIDCKKFKYDINIRKAVRGKLGLKNEMIFVHVGRFSKPKNHQFLIDIFHEINKTHSNSILLLVGTGELQSEIKEKVARLNLDKNVKFLGLREDVYNVLQACDYFLFPSIYEGLPLTLVEAQAAGLKCYVSDVISKQIEITDLLKMISLTKSSKEWADIILSDDDTSANKEMSNKLVFEKYDSRSIANKLLQEFYSF